MLNNPRISTQYDYSIKHETGPQKYILNHTPCQKISLEWKLCNPLYLAYQRTLNINSGMDCYLEKEKDVFVHQGRKGLWK